ncbi:carbohydrate kinase family protein [Tumebacillus sp. ITR2]|uniref:Carbohydrate kinase family protein n=1 Tax=Tumebacillus amylolyticus TaxID=2801339 RepID=A0ABS1J7L6_9BACL|nr:carbohydrate kinase family protein [Tumebacillus amylolyticus]MBL0386044.1 carbohydrate kinase family protein [Tumebacillus amylolyticus]
MTITVIGTVFVDIKGYANAKINAECKNVGDIEFVSGGVGRNVAEAIARAGGQVEFLSSVDVTSQGDAVLAGLQEIGISTNRVVKADRGMGMWLAVLDHDGDLAASISQKPNLQPLETLLETQGEEIVKNTDAIVIEFDLAERVVNKIFGWAKQYGKPVYGIVGNLDVLMQRKSMINELNLFICNKAEAEEFLGLTLTSPEECKMAARQLTMGGLQTAVITMGEHGSVFYDRLHNEFGYVPCESVQVVDTTGAGDSFFSGTVYGLANGFGLQQAVECGTNLAAWTISSKANVDPEIQVKVQNNPLFQRARVLN